MLLSMTRRLATPIVAATAAMGLLLGGAVTAAADPPPPASSGDQSADNLRWNLGLTAVNGLSTVHLEHVVGRP